mgnify:CR=1 FL=1
MKKSQYQVQSANQMLGELGSILPTIIFKLYTLIVLIAMILVEVKIF